MSCTENVFDYLHLTGLVKALTEVWLIVECAHKESFALWHLRFVHHVLLSLRTKSSTSRSIMTTRNTLSSLVQLVVITLVNDQCTIIVDRLNVIVNRALVITNYQPTSSAINTCSIVEFDQVIVATLPFDDSSGEN